MNLKTFIFGLLASFGLPWFVVVAIPYAKMQRIEPVAFDEQADGKDDYYQPKANGKTGSELYGANGCYNCHSQLIRPTTAGSEMWRNDWAGVVGHQTLGDSRRISNSQDYKGASPVAHIGLTRNGPDFSNLGRRLDSYVAKTGASSEEWLYLHLYNPRMDPSKVNSTCPSQKHLFEEIPAYGNGPIAEALPVKVESGKQIVPTAEAKILVSYLVSLKRDDTVPKSIDYNPAKPAPDKDKAAK